jgi:hypothetical protein
MQMVQHHVIYSPEKQKNSGHNQNTCNHAHIKYKHNQVAAHSVPADPPPSHLNGRFFFFFLHVISALPGFNCPSFLSWVGRPGFTPSL